MGIGSLNTGPDAGGGGGGGVVELSLEHAIAMLVAIAIPTGAILLNPTRADIVHSSVKARRACERRYRVGA
jgi:hypothetical protein